MADLSGKFIEVAASSILQLLVYGNKPPKLMACRLPDTLTQYAKLFCKTLIKNDYKSLVTEILCDNVKTAKKVVKRY